MWYLSDYGPDNNLIHVEIRFCTVNPSIFDSLRIGKSMRVSRPKVCGKCQSPAYTVMEGGVCKCNTRQYNEYVVCERSYPRQMFTDLLIISFHLNCVE